MEMDVRQPGQGEGDWAQQLNRGCFCLTLDQDGLAQTLDDESGILGFAHQLRATHPTLFSNVPVFVPPTVLDEMKKIVEAVETATQLAGYRDAALSRAPSIATQNFGPIGALMGYDFHITDGGPRLIEVNTNAGGAFLNVLLARSQQTCCPKGLGSADYETPPAFDDKISHMFVDEWRRQRGDAALARIAIVDDTPEQQFLFPEFQLAKALLRRQGIETLIADPARLVAAGDGLSIDGQLIDLVYNRLVDFAFAEPRHATLRNAYAAGGVVVTPNPHVHALFADKRNLAVLSDPTKLRAWGLAPAALSVLTDGVPKTRIVSAENAEELWRGRNQLFFKPAGGHGSKAAYRGDKITRKVWASITSGSYVAQSFAPASVRSISGEPEHAELKVDIRLYTYAGSVLLGAARLYQGQTTNMRTPGGGFAPILIASKLETGESCAIPPSGTNESYNNPCGHVINVAEII
jgi:hypothetical protein